MGFVDAEGGEAAEDAEGGGVGGVGGWGGHCVWEWEGSSLSGDWVGWLVAWFEGGSRGID